MKSIDCLCIIHQILYYFLTLFGFQPFVINNNIKKNKKYDYRNIILSIFYIIIGIFLIGFLNFLPYNLSNTVYIILVIIGFIFILLPILQIYLNQIYTNSIHIENVIPLSSEVN